MHARGRSRWLTLHDVDEYIQVASLSAAGGAAQGSLADFLHQHSTEKHIAAYAACMFFFGSSTNATAQAAQTAAGQGLMISQSVSRTAEHVLEQREKLIDNPHSTSYVSLHVVTTGWQVKRANASSELRLTHYKSPASHTYPVIDTSMATFAGAVRSQIADWYQHQEQQV